MQKCLFILFDHIDWFLVVMLLFSSYSASANGSDRPESVLPGKKCTLTHMFGLLTPRLLAALFPQETEGRAAGGSSPGGS